ncbi:MAG: phenylalanine--tRNA ligase subunit beta, partial [Actinobacteria bacterium]
VRTVKVLSFEKHPNADKLLLVDIDLGNGETRRVVCGASNFSVGDIVPWAPPAAELPGGFKLERRKIRGEVSDGMLCAPDELGLSDDHRGIMILPPDSPLGEDIRTVLGLDDIVFDLEITPNRPDAMSIAGVARDLAAALGVPFSLPRPAAPSVIDLAAATLVVEAPDRCPRYVARTGRVAVAPSPGWMAQRLTKAGMRPISNVVDVTNYVMLERGQPLHAFDLARLGGRGIVVRLAAEGEKIITLDGAERTLTAAELLICDANRVPQAVAGVMGAGDSEVSDVTTELLLESAYFTGDGILRTSKRLGLRTESSARFERGVDPNGTAIAADRAWELFAEVASSQAAAGTLDAYPAPIEAIRVSLRTARVNDVLGTDLDTATIRGHLEPLGFTVPEGVHADGHGGVVEYVVPTYRPDCEREIDLIEEVARHHGYNNIARTLPRMKEPSGGLTPVQLGRRAVRDALLGTGLSEAYTFSLVAPADLAAAGLPPEGIELENPLRAEESLLRPAVLPGLLRAAAFNAGHGLPDVGLFEIGHAAPRAQPARRRPRRRRPVRDRGRSAGAGRLAAAARRRRRVRPRAGGARRRRRRGGGGGGRDRPRRPRPHRPGRAGGGARGQPLADSRSHPEGAALGHAVPLPSVDHRPGLRPRRTGPGRRRPAHAQHDRRRPARGRAPLRRLPVRGPRAQQEEPGLRPALPGPRPHPHRRGGRRAAPAADRRHGQGTRRRPAGLSQKGKHSALRPPAPADLRRGRPAGRRVPRPLAGLLR